MVRSVRFTGDPSFLSGDWTGETGRRSREDRQVEAALEVQGRRPKKKVVKPEKPKKASVVSQPPPPAVRMDQLFD